ncbi:MAG: tetratricopeptide repeat protein [Planctomycetota bacterium]
MPTRTSPPATGPSAPWAPPWVWVLVLALAVRLLHLAQVQELGFFTQPVSDAGVFVERARGILAGDLLGPADFVLAPLYPYALSAAFAVGDEIWAPRILQCVLGAAACALLARLGERLFDRRVGTLAGLLLALYPPAIFFDGIVQKTSLAVTLSVGALAALLPHDTAGRWQRAGLAGVLLGALALVRQNALILAPLAVAWILTSPAARGRRAAASAALALGLALPLAPWALRNNAVLGDLVLTTPNLGQNFAMGNHADATGTYFAFERGTGRAELEQRAWVAAARQRLGREPTAAEVSTHFLAEAWAWIRAHPLDWLTVLGRKALALVAAYEAFDTEDYYLYRQHSTLVGVLDRVFHFGVLLPLAVAGLALTRRRWRGLWLAYGWLVLGAVSLVLFFVLARYRMPLVPVLVWFAAAGIVRAADAMKRGQWRSLAIPATLALGAAVLSAFASSHPRRTDPVSHTNHATVLRDAGRSAEAVAELRQALALRADHVGANLAMCVTLTEAGQPDQAIAFGQRALTAAPDYAAAHRAIGDALLALGRGEQARMAFSRALQIDPDDYRATGMLATLAAQGGQLEEALRLFTRAVEQAPDYAEGHLNLGNTLLMAGRRDDAAAAYERALQIRPDFVTALTNLGVVEQQRGNAPRATALLERALRLDPDFSPARRALGR